MATYTDNYTMTKPTYAEQADISVINANMDIIDNVMHSSQISLAPAYDINETYNTGDIVMHELLMYKCLEDNVTGAWDSTKWTRTTAGEESGSGADLDIYGEASGTAEASFLDGAEASLVECEIGIVPTQDLHGYSKPWAGGAGKNKYPDTQDINLGGTNPRTVTNAISVPIGAGTYVISWKSTGEATPNLQMRIDGVNTSLNSGSSFTVTSSANQCYWFITTADYDANKTAHIYDIQIESGSTPSGYEPYSNICPISGHTDVTVTVASTSGGSGEDTTVSLGRTVYGGTLDVTTGELIVTHGIVDLGTLTWIKQTDTPNYVVFTQANPVLSRAYNYNFICTQYATAQKTRQELLNGEIGTSNAALTNICIRDDSKEDLTEAQFKTAMGGVMLVYELATPQTFTLSPEQIQTLLGQNYVSHDGGGTISLVYIKKDSTIIPNPSDAEVPLTDLEISGKGFKITDARIPAPPTTNGAYVLTVTVSGGTPTYSWENA